MWVPFLNRWPVCALCHKPVERFTEIEWTVNKDALLVTVACHGETRRLTLTSPDTRRLHFPEGEEVTWPSQESSEAPARGRRITL